MKSAIQAIGLSLFLPFLLKAQDAVGIHFQQGLTWPQIQAKAATENKLIFVDCYATWCEPCKAMDREVYTDPEVGKYLNAHFISVRVQMDATKMDDASVQAWRADAQAFAREYQVTAYPTALLFSSGGTVLNATVGFQSAKDFLALARRISTPAEQYYVQLELYRSGKDYSMIPKLVEQIRLFDGEKAAHTATLDYIDRYLAVQPDELIATKENVSFAWDCYLDDGRNDPALGSAGRIFRVLYRKSEDTRERDKTWELARRYVDSVITLEAIEAKLWQGIGELRKPRTEDPDWDALSRSITANYNETVAKRNILYAQYHWYSEKKDYPTAAKAWLDYMDLDGVMIAGGYFSSPDYINRHVWDLIFEHCTSPDLLARAIPWAERAVATTNPEHHNWSGNVDTLANLLYKTGRIQEGIELEKKAAARAAVIAGSMAAKATGAQRATIEKRSVQDLQYYRDTLEKMNKGLPTWGL